MKVTVDTNVLLRVALNDDMAQRRVAVDLLDRTELVAISLQSLCEFVWVLARRYETRRTDIAAAIRRLLIGLRSRRDCAFWRQAVISRTG